MMKALGLVGQVDETMLKSVMALDRRVDLKESSLEQSKKEFELLMKKGDPLF